MSRSRRNKHPHCARSRCGVCQLGGGEKSRARALASEPLIIEPALTPTEQRNEDEDVREMQRDYWSPYAPDYDEHWERPPLRVALLEGARFA